METPSRAPRDWIHPIAFGLSESLAGAAVEGAISGPGWLSLRTDRGFLWLWIVRGERLVWVSEKPLPRRWLDLLGRHGRSPFAPHLRGGRLDEVLVLVDPDGALDGLAFTIAPGARRLAVRFYPRPGAIWVEDGEGQELARQGRMDGVTLAPRPPEGPGQDMDLHAGRCHDHVVAALLEQIGGRLGQQVRQNQKRLQRRSWTLEGDLARARAGLADRARADLLAAHLHEVRAGQEEIRLTGFEGSEEVLALDPALAPHANLDRWYRRAAKAERAVDQVGERLEDTRAAMEKADAQLARMQGLGQDLDAWLDFADAEGLDPRPRDSTASAQKRAAPERLPYWVYRWGDWEVRVGRTAADNDELTLRHSHLRDLWLHAQGTGGSHVILRSAGKPVPGDVVEDAARIAAHFSQSKTSSTVAVHVVERRYVRKPRKAPPGTVKLERAKTLFVEPGIPERWVRE